MYAVIMAGGKGERLWPKSTRGKGKHMLAFGTKNVMIKETIKRLTQHLAPENIFLITTKKQFSVLKPYVSVIPEKNMILEPEGKDTAAAICLAALTIEKRFGNVPMVILPADHIIKDSKELFKSLELSGKIAGMSSCLVTIGIKPKYPSVGYGYIEAGKKIHGGFEVKRFTEKPEKKKAESFYKSKNYLWNSGIFIWNTASILSAVKKYLPNLYYAFKDVVDTEGKSGYAIRLAEEYSKIKPVSIDYGLMEPAARDRAQKIFCVKSGFDWVDIGSWSSVEEIYDKDVDGNIILSSGAMLDVSGCTIIGERGHKIGAIGVKNLIIVQTKAGTLICNKDSAQRVKDLVKKLKS
ncbi:MAG: mannose-1-phosphate guanylyltransferase [Candidatus Omnitrophica bacterium]|nr:mannose-1-phosphate guanylyltransferase [Candidatus Omnitrophota bacterium]